MRERTELERRSRGHRDARARARGRGRLIELGEAEGDQAIDRRGRERHRAPSCDAPQRQQVETLLSGEADGNDTYLEVHAGAGGTESQDWAKMLHAHVHALGRARTATRSRSSTSTDGEEAGIKGATLLVKGHNAYGWLKTESGVHRLVRISPFDSNARRHTSFASVWVYPVVDDQHRDRRSRNPIAASTPTARPAPAASTSTRPNSAVRITHIPTGIVVACQSERSQHKNRATAWKMLRARLYEAELKKREEKASAEAASKTDIGWGHQIRSYVLQPYQLVKDLRTGVDLDRALRRARRRPRPVHGGRAGAARLRHDGRGRGRGIASSK